MIGQATNPISIKTSSYNMIDARVSPNNDVEYVTMNVSMVKKVLSRVKKLHTNLVCFKFDATGLSVICYGDEGVGLHITLDIPFWYYYVGDVSYVISKHDANDIANIIQKAPKEPMQSVIFCGQNNSLCVHYMPSSKNITLREYPSLSHQSMEEEMRGSASVLDNLNNYNCVISIGSSSFAHLKTPSKKSSNELVHVVWDPVNKELTFQKSVNGVAMESTTQVSSQDGGSAPISREIESQQISAVISLLASSQSRLVKIYLHDSFNIVFEFDADGSIYRCIAVCSE